MDKLISSATSRRAFLRGGLAAIALPTIIPGAALGAGKQVAANDRITMGTIGIGGRGKYVMGAFMQQPDVHMVAVCDVQGNRRKDAKNRVDKHYGNKNCVAYRDFQELLARDDIDAVLIATGDNWHAMASIMAARAGKDIYCEKPMSVTIGESRAVAETVRRYARVYQCGTQRRNIGHFVFAIDLARSGRLGKLTAVHAEKAGSKSGVNFKVLPTEPEPDPEVMDWNGWLGPAPWRPYNRKYYTRGFWSSHGDFSGGSICEWGSHTVDLCQWANDADDTVPLQYRTINDKLDVEAVDANGVKLVIRKGLRFGTCPVRFEGEEGWVETGDSGHIEAHPNSLLEDRKFRGGYPADNHVRDFLTCVRTRRQPRSNADVAHRSITACHLANISVRLGREITWDPTGECFLNDPEADRLRTRAMRQPWHA